MISKLFRMFLVVVKWANVEGQLYRNLLPHIINDAEEINKSYNFRNQRHYNKHE